MEAMKKKITQKITKKVAKKPLLKSLTHEEKTDRNTAILEEIQENFRAFGQEFVALHKKTDIIFDEVGLIRVDLYQIKMRLDSVENDVADMRKEFKGMRLDIGILKDEVKFIKHDIAEIKKTLTAKADIKYITLFEARVVRLEKRFL